MMKNKQGLNHDLQDLHDSKNNTTKSGQSLNQKNQRSDNLQPFYNTTIPSDWTAPEFGTVFSFLKSFSFSREQLTNNKTNDEIRNIHYGDIHATYENEILDFEFEHTVPFLKDGLMSVEAFKDEEFPALKDGDLIIADASEDYEGVCACIELKNLNRSKVVSGLHTFAARAKKEKIAFGFRTYVMNHQQVVRELRRIATGISVYSVSKTNLAKVKIPLPPLPEQKAIAHILGLMDEAINNNNQIIAQKELRKKWLMQNLLTGKKRLKGFNREWKEYHLGSLGDTYTGLTGKSKEDFGEGKPYIPYLNIFFNTKIDTTNFDYVKITEQDKQNKAQYGDIFFTVSSETPDEVGMASVLLEHIDELYLNSFCFGFRLHDFKTLVPQFSSYFLRADAFREEIYKLSQGATRFNLSKTNLMKLIVILPPIEEQIAIAQVLQAADKEIQLLKTKTEKLKEQKKWLMQVLLTGKKRLNYDSSDLYDDYDSNANYKSDKSQESEKS